MSTIDKLRSLLADGKTKEVVNELRIKTQNHVELGNEVLQISAQYAEIERQQRLNTIDPSQIRIEKNRINAALLDIIDNLAIDVDVLTQKPESTTLSSNWLRSGGLIIALLVVYIVYSLIPIGWKSVKKTPRTDSSTVILKPVSPLDTNANLPKHISSNVQKIEKEAPHKLMNLLKVTASSEAFTGLFTKKMSNVLNQQHIAHQLSNKSYDNIIECTFDLQKTPAQSGVRQAYEYSLTLEISIYRKNGEICFSEHYASTDLIGYPEDGQDEIRRQIIEPCLAEIENAIQLKPPTLCIQD